MNERIGISRVYIGKAGLILLAAGLVGVPAPAAARAQAIGTAPVATPVAEASERASSSSPTPAGVGEDTRQPRPLP